MIHRHQLAAEYIAKRNAKLATLHKQKELN
jgi:hypothetical protein